MSAAESPASPRLRFAEGEYLTRFPAGAPHALRLDCRHEKPGWQPCLPGSQTEARFPGTAVFFEQRYYEVAAAREAAGGWVSYYLDPWDEAMVLRRIVELSPEASAREAQERRRDLRRRGTATSLALLAPLVGLLPARYQEEIERRHGLPASRATAWSAVPLLAVSAAAFVLFLGKGFAGAVGAGGGARPWQALGAYFMAESLWRLGAALAAGEASGSLPVVLAAGVLDLVRGRGRRAAAPPHTWTSSHRGPLADADQVTSLGGEPPRLEIISRLPKPHWSRATGIRYQARWYRLVDAQPAARDGAAVHRFVLEEDPEALSMRGAAEYDPREVVTLEWEARRARQATWVETFAPFWGLLDAASQERLASAYDFDPRRATRLAILAAAVAGTLALGLSTVYLATGEGGAADAVILLAGAALVADGLRRALAQGRGRIVASWLAPLVRPFCAAALSASSPPAAR